MLFYRARKPSFDQQRYKLLKKKSLQRKRFFLVGFVSMLAISAFAVNLDRNEGEISGATFFEPFIPAPMPTEMNANFMNQADKCFMPVAKAYGYTLRITSGFRSLDEQEDLYMQGRTVNGHIVTEAPAGKSIHNYGYAIDVVDRFEEFEIDWKKLGRIGAYCKLEQADEGDLPHFEHRGGLTTDQFKAGRRPRDLTLPCQLMSEKYDAQEQLTLTDLTSCGTPNF